MDNLDRELSAALDVEPSVEFRARVRERVARESMTSAWTVRSRVFLALSSASAVVAVVVAVVLFGRPGDAPRPASRISHATIPAPIADATVPSNAVPALSRRADARRAAVAGRSVSDRPPKREVEVLVSASERAGLRLMIDAIAGDRLRPQDAEEMVVPTVTAIAITPMEPVSAVPFASFQREGDDQ